MGTNKKMRGSEEQQPDPEESSGILKERILVLVFKSMQWDLQTLCIAATVNKKLCAIAKRLLWRELCIQRAPRMLSTLTNGSRSGRFDGGWQALAKLLFYCCGCVNSTRHFKLRQPSSGHLVKSSRFSKTSGSSFLSNKCRSDLLYVSDPCEHPGMNEREDDLGIYRGVFRGFMKSRTRAWLIRRQVGLEESVRCPYCGARVWSMTTARLLPRSAARRLGSRDDGLEYFVCLNGHLHGSCWLTPLSSDDDRHDDDSFQDFDNEQTLHNGSA